MGRVAKVALCLLTGVAAVRYNDEGELVARISSRDDGGTFNDIMTRMAENPIKVFTTLKGVVDGTKAAVQHFNATPPETQEGVDVIQFTMWNTISSFASEDFKNSQDFKDAQQAWNDGFDGVDKIIEANAGEFSQQGNASFYAEIISEIITVAQTTAKVAFGNDDPLAKQFNAYASLTKGTCDAFILYEDGKTEEALEAIWDAFNSSIVVMVGPAKAAEPGFIQTMKDLDTVVSALMRNVVDVKKAKINSQICYKQTYTRPHVAPSVCADHENWDWDQRSTCYPKVHNGADCGHACVPAGAQCDSFCPREKNFCCRAGDPNGPQECKYASFVNHSYTNGTAEDYFQCVAPVRMSLAQESAEEKEEEVVAKAPVSVETPARQLDAVTSGLVARRAAGALVQTGSRKMARLDDAIRWKCWLTFWRRRSCRQQDPRFEDNRPKWGTHQAYCSDDCIMQGEECLLHDVRLNNKCHPQCKDGYEAVFQTIPNATHPEAKGEERETAECIQKCKYPRGEAGVIGVWDPFKYEVCAAAEPYIDTANIEMAEIAKNTIQAATEAAASLTLKKQVEVNTLVKIINAFGDMAEKFARPNCDFEALQSS